jgi:hypothetical protein
MRFANKRLRRSWRRFIETRPLPRPSLSKAELRNLVTVRRHKAPTQPLVRMLQSKRSFASQNQSTRWRGN